MLFPMYLLNLRRLVWPILLLVLVPLMLLYNENSVWARSELLQPHIPNRDLKIILATGWQMGPCLSVTPPDITCREESHEPWTEWGIFENVWLNPDPQKTYYKQLQTLVNEGLSTEDFLYYSYSGIWDESNCTDGQQPQGGKCYNFKRPRYKRIDTQIGYINEAVNVTYSRRAGYMQRMLAAFPNSEFIVVGHSLGGFTVTYWAGQADTSMLKRVNAVVTLDSPLKGKTGICKEIWNWKPQLSTPFLSDNEVQSVIRKAPRNVPLYTFRHFDDSFVPYEQATLDGAWTDTGVAFADNTDCSHGGVKNKDIVARLISHVMVSGAIGSPSIENPAHAGQFSNPNATLSRNILLSKPTYFPGNITPDIKFETTVNGEVSTFNTPHFNPLVPSTLIQIAPPSQNAPSCYDLSIMTDGAQIDSSDLQSQAVCYSGIAGIGTSDIAVVIDSSCSMGCLPRYDPNKIVQARKSAKLLVDLLEDGDKVSIISFNNSATVQHPLTELNLSTRQQAKFAIDSIQPNGQTSIGDGLSVALQQLNQNISDERAKTVILLSDGVENTSPLWSDMKDAVITSGVTVYVVGLGTQGNAQDLDEPQLREIASSTNGQYYYSPLASDLRLIYDTIAGTVSNRQIIAQRAEFISIGGSNVETVNIDDSIQDVRFVLTWDRNQRVLDFELHTPSGTVINESNASTLGVQFVKEDGYILYKVLNPEAGIWTTFIHDISIRTADSATDSENYNFAVSGRSSLDIHLTVGDPLGERIYRAYDSLPVLATIVSTVPINEAILNGEIRTPSGQTVPFKLFDNGDHDDGAANDGVFGRVIDFATESGSYSVIVKAQGSTDTGKKFERVARQSIVLDQNPRPPADLASMIVSRPGSPPDSPEYCISYKNRGPSDAHAVALFVDHRYAELVDLSPTSTSTIHLLGHDLGWIFRELPSGIKDVIKVQATNIISPGVSSGPIVGIGNDVDLQLGKTIEETTVDRDFGNNISYGGNEIDISLVEGWNLISLPRMMTNPDVNAVLCALQGNVDTIIGFDNIGLTYDPTLSEFSTLQEFQMEGAYWFKATQPSLLRINGEEVYAQSPIYLNDGWNLVAFLPKTSMPIDHALSSIWNEIEFVLGFDGGATSYYTSITPGLNTLQFLQPNTGYWIKVRKPSVLVYPDTQVTSQSVMGFNKAQNTSGISDTNEWLNIYSTNSTYNDRPLPTGSIITAIGADSRPLGQVTTRENGSYGLLAVYHDDAYTPELDGARTGERIRFLINGQPATITNGADPTWTANGDLFQVDLSATGPEMNNFIYLPSVQR